MRGDVYKYQAHVIAILWYKRDSFMHQISKNATSKVNFHKAGDYFIKKAALLVAHFETSVLILHGFRCLLLEPYRPEQREHIQVCILKD